jgi:N-acetyl sugar amidotransferase
MDTSAPDIHFDDQGICNFCTEYLEAIDKSLKVKIPSESSLNKLVQDIKTRGQGKRYDCIVGVSGGVDSSWVLVQAVELGLRPLAVHMDNGWNSNLSVSNISNLIENLDVDLFTYVIDWDEYRGLMDAFFKADVVDVELLYDNALHEVCFREAKTQGIHYVLSGENFSTEGIRMPRGWAIDNKWDGRNIRRIASKFGATIKTFPLFTTTRWLRYRFLYRIQWVPILNFIDFKKETALTSLESRFGYVRYAYKHYESVFTRFYQGYILPKKFGIDKRRIHLSTLVVSGQMTRNEALEDLKRPPLVSERDLAVDLKFFLKKMNWSQQDLDDYISRPKIEHDFYGSDLMRSLLLPLVQIFRTLERLLGVQRGQ